MKKIMHIVIGVFCATAILLFAACNSSEYEEHEQGFTTAHALYDLDYMINMLENNFGLFDVAYWAHGADIHQMAENARRDILESEIMSYHVFYNIMARNFADLSGIGHFWISLPPELLREWVAAGSAYSVAPDDIQALAGYMGLDPSRQDVEMFLGIMLSSDEQFTEALDVISRLVGFELASEMMYAARDGDFERFALLAEIAENIHQQTHSFVTTRIIEDQKIAYLAITGFLGFTLAYDEEILNFFEEIQGFQHLIVDLRGNLGGFPTYFFQMVIAPNISEPAVADGFMFVMYSHNLRHVRSYPMLHETRVAQGTGIMTVAEILESFYLPDLNMSDMYRLDYGFQLRTIVPPRRLARFDDQPAFDGKIWLLTNEPMFSGAEIAARFVQEIGFATLVGDVTGGSYGGTRSLVNPLPNSPLRIDFDLYYITDSRGRPLEAGTIPHHFNRPGMNALETTLALIAEGQY